MEKKNVQQSLFTIESKGSHININLLKNIYIIKQPIRFPSLLLSEVVVLVSEVSYPSSKNVQDFIAKKHYHSGKHGSRAHSLLR